MGRGMIFLQVFYWLVLGRISYNGSYVLRPAASSQFCKFKNAATIIIMIMINKKFNIT